MCVRARARACMCVCMRACLSLCVCVCVYVHHSILTHDNRGIPISGIYYSNSLKNWSLQE